MTQTREISLTDYQAFVASSSGISDPSTNSGYEPALVAELARIVPYGGTIRVTADGAADLAEWAGDLAGAIAQEPNPSGARSLRALQDKASKLAKELSR